jgi:cytochrome c oxidase subunit 3
VASEAHAINTQSELVAAHVTDEHGHDGHVAGLHHHFDDMEQQRECTGLGMWSFLGTEVMMFGGLFFSYCLYRWRFHDAYYIGSRHLNINLGTINTFVLLFSSLTMAMAVHSAQERKRKPLVMWLIATMILGAAFLGIKAVEWSADYHEGLIPSVHWDPSLWPHHAESASSGHSPTLASAGMAEQAKSGGAAASGQSVEELEAVGINRVMMYFILYFCMTGLHAIHMVVGLVVVGALTWMASRGQFTNGNDQPVELVGLYWHFVDIGWVFLFPLLYLIGGFHPGGH